MNLKNGFKLGPWTVLPEQNRLISPDGEVHVTTRVMDVLVCLAEHAGEVVSREAFDESVWRDAVVTDDSLTWCISELRRTFGEQASNPRFIETIPKRGYRLVAHVEPLESAPTPTSTGQTPLSPTDSDNPAKGKPTRSRFLILVVIVLILSLGAVTLHLNRLSGPETPTSIAVLPFEAFGTADDHPLIDGLHHDLLTRLSDIGDLRVISRTSVKRYRDTMLPIADIAEELGVAWIVEGAVQQVGDEIQLNAQLIDSQTDSHIWAHTYRRELTAENLFAIQAEIVEDIADSLAATLSDAEETRLETMPTQDLNSYNLYLQGRTYLDTRSEDGMEQALVFFRNAIEHDPDFALAWVGLADTLRLLLVYGYRSIDDVLPEAEAAVERALKLAPELAEAHASLGGIYGMRGDVPGAIKWLKRATELRPGYAEAHNWLSWVYQLLGLTPKALERAEKAVSLNPFSPEALTNLVGSLLANCQYDEALRQARHMHELSLPFTDDLNKALALYYTKHYDEAIDLLEGMQAAWADGGAMALKAMTHIAIGEEQAAKGLLDELNESGDHFSVGMVLAGLGDRDAAFAAFEKIEQWNYWSALVMNHYQDLLGDIPSDRRFESMLVDLRDYYGLESDGSLP
jgi:DNA-binding winged helix-turn-helix (wHTH) protein/TolB-like protein/Tfp pilus assembly protein PilF